MRVAPDDTDATLEGRTQTMFYKTSTRSTATLVAARRNPQRNDHRNAREDQLLARQLTEARRQAELARAAQLSSFERELLQAWATDY
jgi:hypothetical protein